MRSGDWSQNPHMGQRLWLIIVFRLNMEERLEIEAA